jgi:nitrogen fixation NifU-like protein
MMSAISPPQDELRDLYRELILDHARNPRHFGKLENTTHQAEGINPLCGDKLRIYLEIDPQTTISDVSFEGSGCAISVASASLLAETVIGLRTDRALAFFESIIATLSGKDSGTNVDLGKLVALQGVREYPSRVKCATLAWHALAAAINDDSKPATTE